MAITKFGPLINNTIQMLKEPEKIEFLTKDVIPTIKPFVQDNQLRLNYLITLAVKDNIKYYL